MNEDEFRVRTPLFSFGIKKSDNELRISEGEVIILRYWSWKKFGYIRKALSLHDGVISVQKL